MLPASFPHTSIDGGGLYSEALFVIRKNELNAQRGTYECVVDVVAQDDIAVRLGQRSTTGIKSVFERYGFTEDDGSPIILRTHQFRHYLNHIAQLGGLSQAEVAMFSGRKDVRQNDAYNHMTADEAQEPIARALVEHDFMGHLAQVAQKQPMLRSDFLRSGPLAVHATDFGYCVHNFASEPCQLYRNWVSGTSSLILRRRVKKSWSCCVWPKLRCVREALMQKPGFVCIRTILHIWTHG
jgi:hypothetical protein